MDFTMEELLLAFIDTLDISLKKLRNEVGDDSGFAKLTIHQLQYIDAIGALGQPTITEVARKLQITKASVTNGVNKLVSLGFVAKNQSSKDKRVYHVSLTAKGAQIVDAKHQALQDYGEFIRSALNAQEARQFESILAKLVQLFERSVP
jgi:DNA-binding MarR family transcriptional regulator